MTDTAQRRSTIPTEPDPGRNPAGFRPSTRRWNRIALGAALVAVAVGGNALVYTSLDQSQPVVQVVQDVPAGTELTQDMLRPVDVQLDGSVNAIPGDQLDAIVGSYAKVRLVSGSLVSEQSLQATPLVADGSAIVAIQVADGGIPAGLRERVPVQLIVPQSPATAVDAAPTPLVIDGRVIGLPAETANALGTLSLSVEVAETDAAPVAAADDVRVVLLGPSSDPAVETQSAPEAEVVPTEEEGP